MLGASKLRYEDNTMDIESVYPKIRAIIADVLVVNESDISLTSRLIADLGAESIDFLDLIFQLEKEFNIKIPRGQLEKNARNNLKEDEFAQNGNVTAAGLQALKDYFNEVPADYFKANIKVNEIPMLFTVATFCKIVLTALNAQKAAEVLA